MRKLSRIITFAILIISLVGCSDSSKNTKEQVTEMESRINLLQQDVEELKKSLAENQLLDNTVMDINYVLSKLEAIIYNDAILDIKLVYINNLKRDDDVLKLDVDFIEWITGDGEDFPNGFKIVNDIEENLLFDTSSDIPIYIFDNYKYEYKVADDFISYYKQNPKTPYKLYFVEDTIVLIENTYIP